MQNNNYRKNVLDPGFTYISLHDESLPAESSESTSEIGERTGLRAERLLNCYFCLNFE